MARLGRWRAALAVCAVAAIAGPAHPAVDDRGADEGAGRAGYLGNCARCHQPDGSGLPPLFPSLRDSPLLRQEPAQAIRSVLSGRHGVNALGDSADAVMPAHGDLANETIAAILNYLSAEWASAWAITASDVAAERRAIMVGAPIEHPSISFETSAGPMADLAVIPYVTSKGPAMTVADYQQAAGAYFAHCTGCHGVMRQGLPGVPLTPEVMRQRGTEYLRAVINYGADIGMPNWGTGERLQPDEIARLAHFLQHPVPRPPDFGMPEIRASWQMPSPVARRPRSAPGELIAVALHDPGQVAFWDRAKRKLAAVVDTGHAPHLLRASASGRYVVVVSRGGWVTLIDTFGKRPYAAARVRVGFEARAVDVSRFRGFADRLVLAAAYWPPQAVMLDGLTLEPLRLLPTPAQVTASDRLHPAPRVTDILGSVQHPEFIAVVKDTGKFNVVPFGSMEASADALGAPIREIDALTNLRAGSPDASGRFYLVPGDRRSVAVLDTKTDSLAAVVSAPGLAGGSRGTLARDPYYGPVWLTSSMASAQVTMVGADPVGHGPFAWRAVRTLEAHAAGSLSVASHPNSEHVWVDAPFADDPLARGQVTVFDMRDPEGAYRLLPIAQWAGLSGPRVRALQPVYSADGSEVWILVWNEASETSAIVVVDDEHLQVKDVITDYRLVTPARMIALP